MDAVTRFVFINVCSVEFIIGNIGNGVIVLVNCVGWIKRRKISSMDQVLTALAISRIALLWLVIIHILLYLSCLDLFMGKVFIRFISISWIVANHLSIWLATCLSIFYFLKVANFSNSTFRSLKGRVKEVVLVTLLASLLLLSLNIVVTNTHVDFWVDGPSSNKSYSSRSNKSSNIYKVLLFTCSALKFIPFTVSLTTFVLLSVSLWKHMKSMQQSVQGASDARTTAHVRALKTMVAFLLLYAVSLISLLIQLSKFQILEENTIIVYDQITGTVFSANHSCILILADSKLRQASLKALRWVRSRLTSAQRFLPNTFRAFVAYSGGRLGPMKSLNIIN